jgi:DNA repair photolyase
MAGDTFVPFYGAFGANPVPLELSFNYCSHACHYCYANLGKPDRRADIKATMSMLQNYKKRSTYEARLLQMGYPVLVSNRVDPFAKSNYRQFLPVLETMTALKIPVAFQTKGGDGIDKALDILDSPAVWYITIEADTNARAKELAPGAPNVDERFALIDLLHKRGHKTIVGINPCVPEWVEDMPSFLQRIKAAGVWGVWAQELHINTNQRRNFRKDSMQALGPDIVTRANRRHGFSEGDAKDFEFSQGLLDYAQEIGLEPYRAGQHRYSEIWKPYRDCYEHTFPTEQDWVNDFEGEPDGTIVTKQDYLDFFVPKFPRGVMQLGHYICAQNYSLCKTLAEEWGRKWNHNLFFQQLLEIAWNDPRINFCPGTLWPFQFAVDEDETPYWDENGDCYLIWSGGDGYPLDRTVVVLEHPELSLQLVET